MSPRPLKLKHFLYTKVLAGTLSFVLFSTNCAFAYSSESVFYSRRKNLLANLPASTSPQLFQHLPAPRPLAPTIKSQGPFSTLIKSLPLQAGTVRVLAKNPGAAKTILHIQDVHQNLEAQKNISAALAALLRSQTVPLIALEGSSEKIDLTAFHAFPRQDIIVETADALLQKNKISGPVHASFLTPDNNVTLQGVEDQNLYDENVAAFRAASSQIELQRKEINQAQLALNQEKITRWNSDLVAFDAEIEKYHRGESSLGNYVQLLDQKVPAPTTNVELFLQASLLENRINFDQANSERAVVLNQLAGKLSPAEISTLTERSLAYRMGQVSHGQFYSQLKDLCRNHHLSLSQTPAFNDYLQYVILAEAINSDSLFTDVQKMENAAYAKFFQSPAEASLYLKSKTLHLASKLIDFSLTSGEWDEYKRISKNVAATESLSSFEKFYFVAEKRNAALIKNLYRAMEKNKTSVAVLVTGGFHSLGIGHDLRKDGVAYASFTPRITEVVNSGGMEALSIFNQEKTPLDQLFEGQKLFLAQNPGTPATLREGAARISATALRTNQLSFAVVQNFFAHATGWTLIQFRNLFDGATQLIWRNDNGQQSAAFYPNGRIQALNTTLVIAPVLTAIHSLVLAAPFFSFDTLLAYLTYKLILSVSIATHELAHVTADGELSWDTFFKTTRSVFSGFVSGRDIEAATTSDQTNPWRVRAIAMAGPLTNAALVWVGTLLLSLNVFMGYSLLATNVTLLALNAIFSDDLYSFWTGLRAKVYGIASSRPSAHSYNTDFEIILENSPDGMISITSAKNSILRLNGDSRLPLQNVVEDLAGEFANAALHIALGRGVKKAKVARRMENGKMIFTISELPSVEDSLKPISAGEWNAIERRSSMLNCTLNTNNAAATSPYFIYTFSAPVQRLSQDRFQPAIPERAHEIDTLINTPLTQSQRDDVLFFLESNPNDIHIKSLFYLLEHPNLTDLSEKIVSALEERIRPMNTSEMGLLEDFFSRAAADTNAVPSSVRITSAIVLQYFLNRPELLPANTHMISFLTIPSSIETKEGKKLDLTITPSIDGKILIQVRENRGWIYEMLGRLVGKKSGKNSKNQEGLLSFQIGKDTEEENQNSKTDVSPESSLEEKLRTVWFQYRGNLTPDVLQRTIAEWSLAMPLGVPTLVKMAAYQYDLVKDAFHNNGFKVDRFDPKSYTLSKINEGPTATPSGTAQSRFGGKRIPAGLYPLVPLIFLIELADEFFHFIAIFAQGFRVNPYETDLLRWNPHLNYYPEPDRPWGEVFITGAPLLGWSLLAVGSILAWNFYPYLFLSFDGWGVGLRSVGIWYFTAAAFGQLLYNVLSWERVDRNNQKSVNALGDLQRIVLQIRDIKKNKALTKQGRARLPNRGQLSGHVNSSLFKIGGPVRDLVKAVLATVLSWVPGNAAAATVRNILFPTTSQSTASIEKTTAQAKKIYAGFQKALQQKFPEEWAAASHDYGYWIMEAQEKVNQNGLFIGSSLDMLTDNELTNVLTPEGLAIYQNRFKNLNRPELKSHLLNLNHFNPRAVEKFYSEKLGRPTIAPLAKNILDTLQGDQYVVVDLLARPWYEGESDHASLEAIQDQPNVKAVALARQIPFTALVMALRGAEGKLELNQEDLLRALWAYMKVVGYEERESLNFSGSTTGESFETRPAELWERYRVQMNAILAAIPKISGHTHSRFGLYRLLYFDQPAPTPAVAPVAPINSANPNAPRVVTVRRGGKGGSGAPNAFGREQFIANLLAVASTLSRAGSSSHSTASERASLLSIKTGGEGQSSNVNSAEQNTVAAAAPNAGATKNTALGQKAKSSDNAANADRTLKSPTNAADQAGRSQTVADARAQSVSSSAFAQIWNSLLNRLTLRPSTWLPALYAAVSISGVSVLGLASLGAYGSPGLLIAREALTYLTYLVGVLFTLAFLGRKIIQPLSQTIDINEESLLEKTFGFMNVLDRSVPAGEKKDTPSLQEESGSNNDNGNYVTRALLAMTAEKKSAPASTVGSKTDSNNSAKQKSNSATVSNANETAEILQILIRTTQVLSQVSGQSPQAVLQEISSLQASPITTAILTHMAKASRQQAFLLAVYRGKWQNNLLAQRQAQVLENQAPIEFLQFRRAALILRDELIALMKEQRTQSARTQAGQIRLLQKQLALPGFLDRANVLLSGNKGTVATLLLNSPFRPGQKLRMQIDTRSNDNLDGSFTHLPENLSEADLAILSSVEAAVELVAQKKGVSKENILQLMIDGKLNESEIRLIKEFAMTPFDGDIKKSQNTPAIKMDAATIDAKVQSAAQFLLAEMRTPKNSQTGSSRIAERRLITGAKNRQFASIAARVAASLAIASSVAIASAASQVSTPVKNGLTGASVSAVSSLNPASDVRATVTPPALTRATPLSKVAKESDSSDSLMVEETSYLDKLATDFVNLAQSAVGKRNSAGTIDFNRVLPPVASHGVSDNNPALAMQLLTDDEKTELEILIATKVQALLDQRRLTQYEAQKLLVMLLLKSELALSMKDSIGNKDVGLPLEGGSDVQRNNDVALVNSLRTNMKPSQKLILFVSSNDIPFFAAAFEEPIANARITLIAAAAVSTQGDRHVLDFNQLEAGLTNLNTEQLQNLVILIQDELSWNSQKLEELQALGLVGFFFTRDFMSGVPAQRMDIQFIQKLAQQLSTHA